MKGIGSRGGIVVGYTRGGGSPIYQSGHVKLYRKDPDVRSTFQRRTDKHFGFEVGEHKGTIITEAEPNDETVSIEDVYMDEATKVRGKYVADAGLLGPSVVRHLLRTLKAVYPKMKTISGFRVTGARVHRSDRGAGTAEMFVRAILTLDEAYDLMKASLFRKKTRKCTDGGSHDYRLLGFERPTGSNKQITVKKCSKCMHEKKVYSATGHTYRR
jgi:hypothetical protein